MKPFGILFTCLFLLVQTSSVVHAGEFQTIQLRGDKTDNFSGIVFGPVENDDTLWNIARDYRNSDFFAGPRPRSLYPVMYGIYQLNTRAFQNNNVNALLNNAMLEMPTADFINQIDLREAEAKIEGDESLWREIRAGIIPSQSSEQSVTEKAPAIITPDVVVPELPASEPVPLDSGSLQPQLAINEVVKLNNGGPSSLDSSEMALLNELKSQYAISLETIQVLLDENDRLLERIEQQNLRINDVDKKIDTDIQTQIDALAALQSEIYQTLSENGQLDETKSPWQKVIGFLSQTYVFLSLSAISVIVILIAVGLKLFYKRPDYTIDDDEISESFEDNLLNDDATSDVLAELKAEPTTESLSTDELIADIDQSLILDDVNVQETSDKKSKTILDDADEDILSLDDEDLLDLDDELMVPDAEIPSADAEKALREEIAEIDFEPSDGDLSQDNLDDLFNTPIDEADAKIALNQDSTDVDISIEHNDVAADTANDQVDNFNASIDNQAAKDEVSSVAEGVAQENNIAQETTIQGDAVEHGSAESTVIDDILSEATAELPEDLEIDELAPLDADAFELLNEEITTQSSQIDKDVDAVVRELDQIDMMEQMLGGADETDVSSQGVKIEGDADVSDIDGALDELGLSDVDIDNNIESDIQSDNSIPDIELFDESVDESDSTVKEEPNLQSDEDAVAIESPVDDLDEAIEELLNADMSDEVVQADQSETVFDEMLFEEDDDKSGKDDTEIPDFSDALSEQNTLTASDKLSSEALLEDLPDIDGWLSDDNDVISEIENTSFDDLLNSIDVDEHDEKDDALLKAQQQFAELDQLPSLDSIDAPARSISDELPDFIDVDSLLEDAKAEDSQEPELNVTKNIAEQLPEASDIDADLNSETLGKLDLARAYIEIDEFNDAKSLLEQVIELGNNEEVAEATSLLKQLNDLIKSA